MPTPPRTPAELFAVIAKSGLLAPDRLAAYRPVPSSMPGGAARDAVVRQMTADGVLSQFQAKYVLSGRHKGFFVGDKYKLVAHLGSGGMGQVFLCEHLLLHRLVAIKVLKPAGAADTGGATERFFREARAVAQLDHPNIVRLFDLDRIAGLPYMVMEYVDGANLHAVVADHGPLAVARAVNYTLQAARGLQHAHAAGLVHRDIKPGNLLLHRSGTVKLLDLGLARYFQDVSKNKNLTANYDDKSLIGTADFIAPEQTHDSSAVDIRADIYGLGCTLYFFLTGRAPFEHGSLQQKLLWHQLKPPAPVADYRTDVPPGVLAVLDRMTAKDPADRYQTPADLLAALAAVPASAGPPAAAEMPPPAAGGYQLGLTDRPPAEPGTALVVPALIGDPAGLDLLPFEGPSADPAPAPKPAPRRRRVTPSGRRWLTLAVLSVACLAAGAGAARFIQHSARVPDATPPVPGWAAPAGLVGGGSTFAGRVMDVWRADYLRATGAAVGYDPVGSARGLAGVRSGDYHLGLTEMPLTDAELTRAAADDQDLVHIPLAMGAVAPVYHLPDVAGPVRFTGPILAAIYSGDLTRWDDPRLAQANPGVPLPGRTVEVVYRADGSGTTFLWTEFLGKSAPSWRAAGPAGPTFVTPPPGTGVELSDGMAAAVGRTPGAIGYVELGYARTGGGLEYGLVQNRAGRFVSPAPAGVVAAAQGVAVPPDLRFSLTDAPGEGGVPGRRDDVGGVRRPGGRPDPAAGRRVPLVGHPRRPAVRRPGADGRPTTRPGRPGGRSRPQAVWRRPAGRVKPAGRAGSHNLHGNFCRRRIPAGIDFRVPVPLFLA